MKGIAIGLLLACGVMASGYTYISDTPKVTYRYDYVVQSGDTLWSIASAHVDENEDVREYMYNLKQFNEGNDVINLKPGQVITVYHY